MRGRVFSVGGQILRGVAGLGMIAGGAYGYKQYQQDQIINRELPTHREMREFRDNLKNKFSSYNTAQQKISFKALLAAISANQVDIAEEMLNDLAASHATITPEVLDALIVYTANHSKIEILELMQKVFGEEAVLRNRHARDLLALNDEERAKVAHITEEFYQSPGEIRYDGMYEFVKAKQEHLLEQHLEYRSYQPSLFVVDIDGQIVEEYKRAASIRDITQEMETKFKRTIVVDLTDYPDYETHVENFFRDLVKASKEEKQPVVGTYVLTGAHFTLGQIRVDHQEPDQDKATLVFLDPKGTYTSILTNDYTFISSLPHHVFKDVEVFISEERVQLAGIGCSLFVADQYGIIMTLDQIMAHNTQYKFAGKKDVLFDYAQLTKTKSYLYGVDYDAEAGFGGTYKSLGKFTLFLLPAPLIVGKQSIDSPGVLEDTPEVFVLEENGRYSSSVVGEPVKIDFPGVMGIKRARVHSSPERQLEFSRPADISGTKTVDETINSTIENAEHKGVVKPRNKRNDNSAYELGFFMSKRVSSILGYDPKQKRASEATASLPDSSLFPEDDMASEVLRLIQRKQ